MNLIRSGPTLTQVPVASLKSSADAAVEEEALLGIARIEEFQRVAELIEAVLVERRGQSSGWRRIAAA